MLFLLMIAISCGHFLKKSKHKYLQEAGLTTMIGMMTGYLLSRLSLGESLDLITSHFVSFFMIVLLPPIIFESGYNMRQQPFIRNIGTILLYSFFGTFVAILSSSTMFYLAGWLGWSYPLTVKDSFAFGSLISATDPVAVLSIFKEMGADEDLYSIVFGESIFNDAIGIVMYETVKHVGLNGHPPMQQVGIAIGRFCLIFVGSLTIGAITALIVAFVLKRQADYAAESQDGDENLQLEK
jgi:NhaP-type Na+/H+ or K+/H+ antiporter